MKSWLAAFAAVVTLSAQSATYTITELPAAAGWREAVAVNRRGDVAGTANQPHLHAFAWKDGELQYLDTQDRHTRAHAINDRGDVAGSFNLDMVTTHACIWTDGELQDLGTLPGGSSSVAMGINKARQVTGWSRVAGAINHAFIYQDGVMTDLGTLGGFRSHGMAINRAGHVAGASDRSDGGFRAFLHDGAAMHDLGTLNGTGWSWANALNDAGGVVGRAGPGDVSFGPHRAALFRNGQVIDLGTLGGAYSEALGINNAGHIVGWSTSSGTNNGAQSTKAFLYRNGQMISLVHRLDPVTGAGWKLRMATGINDAGQIVGWGERDGVQRFFILTPMRQEPR